VERRGGAGKRRLSEGWFDMQRRVSLGLFIWSYALLGLAAVPLLFRDHLSRGPLLVWYVPLLAGFVALGVWLGVQITRSLRLGRADLARSAGQPPTSDKD